jgi:hypothetical protein
MIVKEYVAVLSNGVQRHSVQFVTCGVSGRLFDMGRQTGRTMFQNDIVGLLGGNQIGVLDDKETPNPSLDLQLQSLIRCKAAR